MSLVTVLISAGGASERMLRTCIEAIERHKCETQFHIVVACPASQSEIPAKVCQDMGHELMSFNVEDDGMSGSKIHAEVLDIAVNHVKTPYLLTLDADCFPMSAGWLDRLMKSMTKVSIAGIAHPYAPPPQDMSETGMEYRVRSQLCYDTPHVACMLIRIPMLKKIGMSFGDGDDTGLGIVARAKSMELQIGTIMPTACALPGDEFNRDMCIVYDNCIYHHGGGSREVQDKGEFDKQWKPVRDRVVKEGADFLIDGPVYEYKFDKEEEVADKMVSGILRGMRIYLEDNDKVF
jgi:hypothetical protein